LTTEARPINQNKGFEIIISPSQGLGGLYPINLSSTSTSPVTHSDLSLTVTYGPTGQEQVMMEPRLKEYTNHRWPNLQKLTCRQYPPI